MHTSREFSDGVFSGILINAHLKVDDAVCLTDRGELWDEKWIVCNFTFSQKRALFSKLKIVNGSKF